MLIRIHPENPQARQLAMVKECLNDGGIIAYPTDTIYGLGCSILHHEAVEKICAIKKVDPEKAQLSFICADLSDLSSYAKSIDNALYRILKKTLPGPYTYILPASKQVPKILQSKKKTIGLRIPNNKIALSIIETLGHPILSASFPGENVEDYTDPEIIYEHWSNQIDMVVDGGIGGIFPSTVIDCTKDEYVLLRQGLGVWEY
ncbi:MAG: threonylcarbamoyl-AMP synthase [Chitinophagia bacterium]|nr:threonylcarbamoyl-AMP synthase [Chitinophagia bacterium]NCA30875.1 threonylcarbamoyl-AMP synthase [Chitinophagia bacterium]NDD16785.1 threonylcarbamoyl-AMP synthase [Chitinophagia bacterium]